MKNGWRFLKFIVSERTSYVALCMGPLAMDKYIPLMVVMAYGA